MQDAKYISAKDMADIVMHPTDAKFKASLAMLKAKMRRPRKDMKMMAGQDHKKAKTNILVGVTSNRKFFKDRVAAVISTWGKPENVPDNVVIQFFVGDLKNERVPYASGSVEDAASLAKEAGIVDQSSIIVMAGIDDDEYPLVDKASSVIKHLEDIVLARETEIPGETFDWIFDVDDDTYVNFKALQDFVDNIKPAEFQYIGQRGTGKEEMRKQFRRGGLVKPYCMGGTGIIYSRPTLNALALKIDYCVKEANLTKVPLYDDMLIGVCVHRYTGMGCWDGKDYYWRTFAQNYNGVEDFVNGTDLLKTITLHPFKEQGSMVRQHLQFVSERLKANQTVSYR
jgi:hypothetical protein